MKQMGTPKHPVPGVLHPGPGREKRKFKCHNLVPFRLINLGDVLILGAIRRTSSPMG